MRCIIPLLIILLVSCSSGKTPGTTAASDSLGESTFDKSFDDCFTTPDATFEQTVTGCAQGFFKVIGDQFVLRIASDRELQPGECTEWQIEANDPPGKAELLIFSKGEASLMNCCTGNISVLAPEPRKRLNTCLGTITLGRHSTDTADGSENAMMSIYIEQLVFVDLETYEEIVIQDELFWQVPKRGLVK